jgi:putative flippase GtrA
MNRRPLNSIAGIIDDLQSLYEKHDFLRFLITGGVNTVFGYSVFCLVFWISGRPIAALAVATILGTLFNFLTIGNFVFRNAEPRLLWRFIAIYAMVFAFNAMGLSLFDRCGFNSIVAQAILTPLVVAASYLLNRRFVFRIAQAI